MLSVPFLLSACAPAAQPATQLSNESFISVNASAIKEVVPDIATVRIGVNTSDPDAAKCQADNASIVQKIVTALAEKVPSENIKTNDFYMFPSYDNSSGQAVQSGYEMNSSLQISQVPAESAAEIASLAVDAGATSIQGIEFDYSKKDEVYQEALRFL